jgi:hypothetical protein
MSLCPSVGNNSARNERMVVFITKVTVAVIFTFFSMVAMFNEAAIDFLVTVAKVTKGLKVTFTGTITTATSIHW